MKCAAAIIVVFGALSVNGEISGNYSRSVTVAAHHQSNLCHLTPSYGYCNENYIRYYYNPDENRCSLFYYSGCGGNGDIYKSLWDCEHDCLHRRTDNHSYKYYGQCEFCSKHAYCMNGECKCRSGYEGDGYDCRDINECISKRYNKCHKNAYCFNTIGSYRCECQIGYAGNGFLCVNSTDVCEQPFDETYTKLCTDSWEFRIYYNSSTNSCQRFWYGGCMPLTSQNFFNDAQTCEEICVKRRVDERQPIEHPLATRKMAAIAEICHDSFDSNLLLNCGGKRETRWYYNQTTRDCEKFRYDVTCGYTASTQNMFKHYETCKRQCLVYSERQPNAQQKHDRTHNGRTVKNQRLEQRRIHVQQQQHSNLSNDRHRCLEAFDPNYQHDCWGENRWGTRYYYNGTLNECVAFWYAGCKSTTSQNIFYTIKECEKTCVNKNNQPQNPAKKRLGIKGVTTKPPKADRNTIDMRCLEPFDTSLKRNCDGQKSARSYYNSTTKQCEFFSFDLKCEHKQYSGNLFDFDECEDLCKPIMQTVTVLKTTERAMVTSTVKPMLTTVPKTTTVKHSKNIRHDDVLALDECLEPFDPSLKRMCGNGDWKPRYYYSVKDRECRIFWWDMCRSSSRNYFTDLLSCQRKCEGMIARPCLEPFDEAYKKSCSSTYELRWYYNQHEQKCDSVYYGGCKSTSRNLFSTRSVCKQLCERPTNIAHGTSIASVDIHSATVLSVADKMHQEQEKSIAGTNTVRFMSKPHSKTLEAPYNMNKMSPKPKANLPTKSVFNCSKAKIRGIESVEPPENVKHIGSFKISEECLDWFEEWLTCSCRDGKWERRYFYSISEKKCKLYWYDGCKGTTRNDFDDLNTCFTKCQGIIPIAQIKYITRAKNRTEKHQTIRNRYSRMKHVKTRELSSTVGKHSVPVQPTTPLLLRISEVNITTTTNITPAPKIFAAKNVESTPSGDVSRAYTSDNLLEALIPMDDDNGTVSQPTPSATTAIASTLSFASLALSSEPGTTYSTTSQQTEVSNNSISPLFNHDDDIVPVVSMAEECLEPFDHRLEFPCNGGKWVSRYFYNQDSGECQMYWYDGCASSAGNNFNDLASCKWKCEGKHINPRSRSCLDTFDNIYLKKCWTETFYEKRYYFNHEKKQCELFYYGGCSSNSKNIFLTFEECEDLCERPGNELFRACYEPFDHDYEKSCSGDGTYRMQYYYDNEIKQCRMFWFGNCKGTSENIFPSLATCQWICERRKIEEVPRKCIDKFDHHYADSCSAEIWKEKWYFNHTTGLCSPFWYGGCTSESQNIFDNLDTCLWLCEKPDLKVISAEPQNDDNKCLEEMDSGYCTEKHPAFFYNKHKSRCEPFAYSGCGGNGNRFLTLKQCQTTCNQFNGLSEPETGCHLPLAIGHGRTEGCQQYSGFRYYYNKQYGRCGKFWYNGCGGNSNQFTSYAVCERICNQAKRLPEIKPHKEPSACFMPIDVGHCEKAVKSAVVRWAYDPVAMECQAFNYSGCGGNGNRFATKYACDDLCKGLIKPVSDRCAYYPDWGPCNQLRYMWFYNMTKGTCEQFLYGGCDGNSNKFSTFHECQTTCEVPLLEHDICMEPMDRGENCPGVTLLETRWYYSPRTNSCIGYHSEGCGKSANNFKTEKQCQETCVRPHDTNPSKMPNALLISVISSASAIKAADPKEIKYMNKEPATEAPMNEHIILSADKKANFKSAGEWATTDQCFSYRYNVSGNFTKLKVYLCAVETGGTCQMQIHQTTNQAENCVNVKPWLDGLNIYSWFFMVERRPITSSDHQHRIQPLSQTLASIIVLPLNDCTIC